MSQRFFSIGDIHGHFPRLNALLLKLRDEAGLNLNDDKLVFTGDYTDRNLYSKEVIQVIKELKEEFPDNVVVLMGNHEDFLLDYLHVSHDVSFGAGDRWCFEVNGGAQTYSSYVEHDTFTSWDAPRHLLVAMEEVGHYEFIKNMPLYYETDEYWFSHAPTPTPKYNRDLMVALTEKLRENDPSVNTQSLIEFYEKRPDNYLSLVKDHRDSLIWAYHGKVPGVSERAFAHDHGKLAICGHVTELGSSRIYPHIVYNDSGCAYPGGRLSAVELLGGEHVRTYWVS